MKDELLEWYNSIAVSDGATAPPPPPEKDEQDETPQEISKELDKFGELYKILALVRLLEKKLVILSDVYQTMSDDEVDKNKKIIKTIIKKISELSEKI